MFLKLLWTVLGRFGAAGLQAATLVLVARGSNIEEFGLIATFLGAAVFVHVLLDFGVSTFSLKEKTSGKSEIIFSGILFTALSSATLSFILCFGLLGLSIGGFVKDSLFLTPLFFWMAFERVTETLQILLQADGRSRAYSITLFSRRLTPLLLYMGFGYFGIESSWAFGYSQMLSSMFFCAFSVKFIFMSREKADWRGFFSVVRETKAYWLNSVCMQARALDVLILSTLSGLASSASFSAASRLSSPLSIIPTSVATVLLPIVARRELGNTHFNNLSALAALLCATPMLAVTVLAPRVIPFVLGEKFSEIVPALQIVCIGLAFSSAATIYTAVLQGLGMARRVSVLSLYISITYLVALFFAAALYKISSVEAAWLLLSFYVARSVSVMTQAIRVFK